MSSIEKNEIRDKIVLFVKRQFNIQESDADFSSDVDLWEEGFVDSMGTVELIGFLEGEFGVSIEEDELLSPEFTKINGMVNVVAALVNQRAAAG